MRVWRGGKFSSFFMGGVGGGTVRWSGWIWTACSRLVRMGVGAMLPLVPRGYAQQHGPMTVGDHRQTPTTARVPPRPVTAHGSPSVSPAPFPLAPSRNPHAQMHTRSQLRARAAGTPCSAATAAARQAPAAPPLVPARPSRPPSWTQRGCWRCSNMSCGGRTRNWRRWRRPSQAQRWEGYWEGAWEGSWEGVS